MPQKKSYRRRRRKRTYPTSRPRPGRGYLNRAYTNAPFPLIRFAKLQYYEELSINPSGTAASVGYRANGMFDPLASTGGHQPMGFDQLMSIYDHFEVYGSKITVRFLPNGEQYYCGIYLDDDSSSVPLAPTQLMEQRGNSMSTLSVTSTRPTVISKKYSQRRTFGKSVRGSDSQKGTAAADPTEQAVFEVWSCGIGGADPGPVTVLVKVEYFAKFSELRTLGQS